MTRPAIEVAGLRKSFGATVALDGVDLTVATSEVHGFLGPNGAGKTTTLRILLGLLRADGGRAVLLGGDPWRDVTDLHGRLAYVPGDVELGNRQKVALISALASNVELLLSDEPTSGLDPLMEAEFRAVIEEDRSGRTVLLSSHILSEVEALCGRVSIIRAGRIVESSTIDELRHLTRTAINAELDAVPDDLATQPGVHDLVATGHRVEFEVDGDAMRAVMARLGQAGIRRLISRPPTLEELFLRHYDTGPAGRR